MSIVEEFTKETIRMREELAKDEHFVKLENFYNKIQELGVAKSAKYDLPPLDTLGKRFFDIQHSSGKKNYFS